MASIHGRTRFGALVGIGGDRRRDGCQLHAHAGQDLRAEAAVQARVARAATAHVGQGASRAVIEQADQVGNRAGGSARGWLSRRRTVRG
jgi:hypothetical protein